MSRLAALKSATSLSDVARLLGFKPKGVSYLVIKLPPEKRYTTFQIPKRAGGYRVINAPIEELGVLQRNLSTLLQDCMAEINTAKNRKDRLSHGFKRDRSIISNARR